MPANHKVSVGWQIVFTFLPIVNLCAFYRIKKLRKYVLYIVVPSLAVSIIILASYRPPQTPWGEGGFGLDQPPVTSESGDYVINRVEIWRPYGPAFIVGQVIGWGPGFLDLSCNNLAETS